MDGMQTDITIREAAPSESAIILHHRRSMFRDMGEGSVEELDRMVGVAGPWLARALADGTYRHWLALDRSGRVAGGGGVLLCPWPPSPKYRCTQRAVILNVYTEPEFGSGELRGESCRHAWPGSSSRVSAQSICTPVPTADPYTKS
jgi:hypothetical protein